MKTAPSPTLPESLVGAKSLASILSVSRRWIRHQAARGALPHFQMAGIRRFDLEEILSLMRRGPAENKEG